MTGRSRKPVQAPPLVPGRRRHKEVAATPASEARNREGDFPGHSGAGDHGSNPFSGLPARGNLLFLATFQGRTTWVGQAAADEIALLPGPVDRGGSRDHLDVWSAVSIRGTGYPEPRIHVLGWRREIATVWITSRALALDSSEDTVRTASGHVYILGTRDDPELAPVLRAHLRIALQTWGFLDISR